jgi:hypothetical protein
MMIILVGSPRRRPMALVGQHATAGEKQGLVDEATSYEILFAMKKHKGTPAPTGGLAWTLGLEYESEEGPPARAQARV